MPIVFEEVTGEIVPERAQETTAQNDVIAAPAVNIAENVRHELALLRERAARLFAD